MRVATHIEHADDGLVYLMDSTGKVLDFTPKPAFDAIKANMTINPKPGLEWARDWVEAIKFTQAGVI